MADQTNPDVTASAPRPTIADQSVAERFRLASDRRPCPFAGVAYSKVPGYVSGYGCPVCKGIGPAHRDIADPLDFDDVAGAILATTPPAIPADLRALLEEQAEAYKAARDTAYLDQFGAGSIVRDAAEAASNRAIAAVEALNAWTRAHAGATPAPLTDDELVAMWRLRIGTSPSPNGLTLMRAIRDHAGGGR